MVFVLTCSSEDEAYKITHALLDARLVACVKWQPVVSHFIWQGKKESANELLLTMESVEEKYDEIHALVKILHSYSTFVLQGIAVTRISDDVREWIQSSLQ